MPALTATASQVSELPGQLKSNLSQPHTLSLNGVAGPSKEEEAPSGYNTGGYMMVRVGDAFKEGRYVVLRKLGLVLSSSTLPPFSPKTDDLTVGVISRLSG
jgi:hypothetical protein